MNKAFLSQSWWLASILLYSLSTTGGWIFRIDCYEVSLLSVLFEESTDLNWVDDFFSLFFVVDGPY